MPNSANFAINHVGARFGNYPLQVPEQLSQCIDVVLFDADEDCVKSLSGASTERRRVVTACLSDSDGEADFCITVNAPASSLLEPSDESRGYVQPMFGIDWDVMAGARVVERRRVVTARLDTLLGNRPDLPVPDFLSLDTQGSELAILKGAEGTMERGGIVGLIVEVEFVELYQGVSRFGDVASWLEERGFHFAGFSHLINAQSSSQPIGRRSEGFPVAADAAFLSRVDRFSNLSQEDVKTCLRKLAFASVCLGHLDHAFAALEQCGRMENRDSTPGWLAFLQKLQIASDHTPRIFLPQFPDILPEVSVKQFSSEPDPNRWPTLMDLTVWRERTEAKIADLDRVISELGALADTPVEATLREAGFTDLADRTNFARRDQVHKLQLLIKQNAGVSSSDGKDS
jgi:FkbM family methyltransferase